MRFAKERPGLVEPLASADSEDGQMASDSLKRKSRVM